MKNIQKKNILLVGLCALFTSNLYAYDAAYLKNVYNETLKSYDLVKPERKETNLTPAQSLPDLLKNLFKGFSFEFSHVDKSIQLKSCFESFPKTFFYSPKGHVDFGTIVELELLRGKARPQDHYISRMTSHGEQGQREELLSTVFGQKYLTEALSMPVADVKLLKNRQGAIKSLAQNPKIVEYLRGLLNVIKEHEEYFLDFSDKTEVSQNVKNSLHPLLAPIEGAGVERWGGRMVNTLVCGGPIVVLALTFIKPDIKLESYGEIDIANVRICAGIYSLMAPMILSKEREYANAFKQLQTQMIKAAQVVRASRKIVEIISDSPDLNRYLPAAFAEKNKLSGKEASSSKEFRALNNLFEQSTFDDGDATIFASAGNVLRAYEYLCNPQVRKEYEHTLSLIGEIDAYVALAQKINKQQGSKAPLCFVEFIEKSDKPVLEMKDFWNPFIAPSKAVTNDISLNTGAERCMLITGPNTGGKSTNMKAIVANVISAQTFGIAAASSMKITPFEYITTYLNIGDDTAGGKSLFKAEVDRAQQLLASLKNIQPGQFGFAMLDEIFTGTSPDKAEQLAHELMLTLSKMNHVIFVNATHFKPLTRLESETSGLVKNYQVDAKIENGRVTHYTYKLVPGVSQISSAMQVAEEAKISFS